MIQTRQYAGFPVKRGLDLLLIFFGRVGVQKNFLDSAAATFQTQVFGLVNGTHSALTDQVQNPVTRPQNCARA